MSEAIATAQAAQPAAQPTGEQQKTGQGPTADQVSGSSQAPQTNGEATKDAAKEALRKFKVKVDNQELEVDEDELKRGYSHQKAANKILQEGKQAKKQAEQFVQMLKDKGQLITALKKLGYAETDLRELSENYLTETLKSEMMDPRERELLETKKQLQTYKEMEEQQKREVEERRLGEMKKKFAEDYNTQFIQALEETGVHPDKESVAEMAKYIHRSAKIGFEMTPLEAAKMVREDEENRIRRRGRNYSAEQLYKLLGDDGFQKVREYDVAKLKNPESGLRTPQEQPNNVRRPDPNAKRMTPAEWRRFNFGK